MSNMFLPRSLLSKKPADSPSETAKRKVDPISASAKKPKKSGFSDPEPSPPESPNARLAPSTPNSTAPSSSASAPSPSTSSQNNSKTIAGALAAAGAGMSALDAMNLRVELEHAKSMAKAKMVASQMTAQASLRMQQLSFMGLRPHLPIVPFIAPPIGVPQAPSSQVEFTVERRSLVSSSSSAPPSSSSSAPSSSSEPLSIHVPPAAVPTVIAPLSPDSKAKLPLDPYFSHYTGCRSVQRYHKIKAVAQGTYGTVYKAKDNYSDEIVALKRFKRGEFGDNGFPKHFLCEINILSSIKHRNLIGLREVVLGRGELEKADVFLVLDWAEHDMQSIMRKMNRAFTLAECKCLMRQLLRAVHVLDNNSIMHRDLKPANLLYDMDEARLKVCDLGEARRYSDEDEKEAHTPGVISLRYRAPEILMGCTNYDSKVDMWSVGCIFGKLLSRADLLPGVNEMDMITKMFALLGTPTDETWPGFKDTPLFSKLPPAEVLPSKLRERFQPEEAKNAAARGMGTPAARAPFRGGATPTTARTPSALRNATPSHTPSHTTPSGLANGAEGAKTPDITRAISTPTTACPGPSPRASIGTPNSAEVAEGKAEENVDGDEGGGEFVEQDLIDSFLADINGIEEKQESGKEPEDDDECDDPSQVQAVAEYDDTPMGSPCYLSDLGFDLLSKFLQYDPAKRITAKEALRHPFWKEAPLPLLRKAMPKFFEVADDSKE